MKALHGLLLIISLCSSSFLSRPIDSAPVANSQSLNAAEEDIKQVVVMIDATLAGGRSSVGGLVDGVGYGPRKKHARLFGKLHVICRFSFLHFPRICHTMRTTFL